ncbi:hypothetical protein T484DRAFT_1791070 [Baffinella frigidus]|nr:hypothetical protein T484DRAFT_1791070 [Cryptophyta sp. CCMP2293]
MVVGPMLAFGIGYDNHEKRPMLAFGIGYDNYEKLLDRWPMLAFGIGYDNYEKLLKGAHDMDVVHTSP